MKNQYFKMLFVAINLFISLLINAYDFYANGVCYNITSFPDLTY